MITLKSGRVIGALRQLSRSIVVRGSAFTSNRNASSLVVCSHKDGKYDSSVLNTVTAAKTLGGEVRTMNSLSCLFYLFVKHYVHFSRFPFFSVDLVAQK